MARAIEGHIQRKNKDGYRQAVDLLIEHRQLFGRAGENRFSEFVGALRSRHKPKRNLQALLDEVGSIETGQKSKC